MEVYAGDAIPQRDQNWASSDVVASVERASKAAATIGSGGVWLTGQGSGLTDVVAAAGQAIRIATTRGEAGPA